MDNPRTRSKNILMFCATCRDIIVSNGKLAPQLHIPAIPPAINVGTLCSFKYEYDPKYILYPTDSLNIVGIYPRPL